MVAKVDQNISYEVATKPAAKILEFYRDFQMAKMARGLNDSTAHGIAASKTMAELEPVTAKWVEIRLDQWGY